jgi:F0F1-type ATP synthase delta subunit
MGEATLLLIKALAFGIIFTGVMAFVFIKYVSKQTDGAVSRLNRETEQVRTKQVELNEKIKQAGEELDKRRKEADALVAKMTEDAESKGRGERDKIVQKARQEAEEIINKAHRTKDEVRKGLEREMKIKGVDFAITLLTTFLSKNSIGAMDDNLISEFFNDLKEIDMAVISPDVQIAEIVTARPFDEKHQKNLIELLQTKLKRNIGVDAKVDEKMVGGILLRFGNLSLDSSLRTILQNNSENLKERLEKGLA